MTTLTLGLVQTTEPTVYQTSIFYIREYRATNGEIQGTIPLS
ncbi:hypothetical protein W02_40500 [Nitrospira sp. KM1]|nr:hypothetical protein [Nitrospira sp. KM1]BCA56910.1 hypothetical protein W02_40500 [Nitrospira sp. KM1]